MYKDNEVHFEGDFLFDKQALSTATDAQVSAAFRLGQTEGGIRVRAYFDEPAACSSGNAVTAVLKVADKADAAATDWETIASNTVTATGTAIEGEIFSFIPDTEADYMKLEISNSAGMTGTITAPIEYVPR